VRFRRGGGGCGCHPPQRCVLVAVAVSCPVRLARHLGVSTMRRSYPLIRCMSAAMPMQSYPVGQEGTSRKLLGRTIRHCPKTLFSARDNLFKASFIVTKDPFLPRCGPDGFDQTSNHLVPSAPLALCLAPYASCTSSAVVQLFRRPQPWHWSSSSRLVQVACRPTYLPS
jgi:hypothetical protein